MGENDPKDLKTGFPDKSKYLTKQLAYPYEYFNKIDDYQKLVDNLKKEGFFSKLKIDYPSDKEIERTKEFITRFNIKNGEELSQIYLKSDVLLLTCVFEKSINVSVNEYGFNPLYSVSLPSYTWQCGLKYTGINLQTVQDKDMILLIENIIRVGISGVMGDRYVKSNENKKTLYKDANNVLGWAMSESLLYDEIKFDENVKLEDILNAPDNSDIGYFIEVDLKYPDNMKNKTQNIPFAPENKKIKVVILVNIWNKLNLIVIHTLKNWYVIGLIGKIIWFIRGCKNFMLDMVGRWRKFILFFQINRVSGWRNI